MSPQVRADIRKVEAALAASKSKSERKRLRTYHEKLLKSLERTGEQLEQATKGRS